MRQKLSRKLREALAHQRYEVLKTANAVEICEIAERIIQHKNTEAFDYLIGHIPTHNLLSDMIEYKWEWPYLIKALEAGADVSINHTEYKDLFHYACFESSELVDYFLHHYTSIEQYRALPSYSTILYSDLEPELERRLASHFQVLRDPSRVQLEYSLPVGPNIRRPYKI